MIRNSINGDIVNVIVININTNLFNKQITHRTSVENEQGDIIVK